MSTDQISIAVEELVALTLAGKWEVAYEKYYSQDLEKTDLDGIIVKGIEQNIRNGRQFVSRISNVRDFSSAGRMIKGTRSFVLWSFDFDVDGAPFQVTEVALQDWEDGKIVRERFFA